MYGLPKSKDLSCLVGKEVIQVCIGLHQYILAFDSNISISLECDFCLTHETPDKDQQDMSCSYSRDLLRLLGSKITGVTNEGNGELVLIFSEGSTLRIQDSNPGYESYQIVLPNETIVV